MEGRVEGEGGARPRPLIRRSSVTRWASWRGANRAASRYGRPRGGGEVAYRECGYRSSAVSLETRRWLLDFPLPFRFSTARGFRPRALIPQCRFRSAVSFPVPWFPWTKNSPIFSSGSYRQRDIFEQGIGRRGKRIGWREMDFRIHRRKGWDLDGDVDTSRRFSHRSILDSMDFERWKIFRYSVSSVAQGLPFPLLVRYYEKW